MKNTLLLILISTLIFGCSKEDTTPKDELPLATQIGANTAGCYINGQLIIAKDGINGLSGYPVYGLEASVGPNFSEPVIGDDYIAFRIANIKSKGKGYWISLKINNIQNGVGIYNVRQSDVMVRETYDGVSGKTFFSGNNAGTITITRFDYYSGIYSGIFDLEVYNSEDPTEIIAVKQGRFDRGPRL